MFSAIRTSSERLHIPHVFFFSSFKAPASLAKRLNGNGFSVPNASEFVDEIYNIDIKDDEIMLSFDVVSLFTAIPSKKPVITFKLNWIVMNHYIIYAQILIPQLFRLQ